MDQAAKSLPRGRIGSARKSTVVSISVPEAESNTSSTPISVAESIVPLTGSRKVRYMLTSGYVDFEQKTKNVWKCIGNTLGLLNSKCRLDSRNSTLMVPGSGSFKIPDPNNDDKYSTLLVYRPLQSDILN